MKITARTRVVQHAKPQEVTLHCCARCGVDPDLSALEERHAMKTEVSGWSAGGVWLEVYWRPPGGGDRQKAEGILCPKCAAALEDFIGGDKKDGG